MPSSDEPQKHNKGRKTRIPMRRNRGSRPRTTDWTRRANETEGRDLDSAQNESVVAKGELSRQRTIIVHGKKTEAESSQLRGVVTAVLGLYADVDDGQRVWRCTIRQVLRSKVIEDRHPVVVGDRVNFRLDESQGSSQEGVIISVETRKNQLQRGSGNRLHTIAANVDQVLIVSSAAEPPPKSNLIDRYTVSALSGGIQPAICMNKIDLDTRNDARRMLDRYAQLGWPTVATSIHTGEGMAALRAIFANKSTAVAGQSGVGKSSLLNVIQPGLKLRVNAVGKETLKGRHTTTTAVMLKLDFGGFVVDTPGVRAFDIGLIPRGELEALFVEFVPYVFGCKFPDCSHRHEKGCAVLAAVESGRIHPERYESYVKLFEEPIGKMHR
ncbi:MAG: ribosome small subunit-dependent GTPase A [Planctomycetota bacterium]